MKQDTGYFDADRNVRYFDDSRALGYFDVVFIINKTGHKLVKEFNSPVFARDFIRKLRHSKRCTLVSYPNV